MRNHRITCHLEDNKPINEIQYLVNCFATAYIENLLKNSGLSKDEQICVLSEMLQNLN